jgi:hypothetical protein
MKKIVVTGYFGQPHLSALYGSAIGPSPAEYRMQGELIQENPDGSALVAGKIRTWDGMVNRHPDGTRCNSYPCNQQHHREWECEWKATEYTVPAGYWKLSQ